MRIFFTVRTSLPVLCPPSPVACLVFLLLLCTLSPVTCPLLLAQSTNASVGGQITDQQGRVVPGVNVVLTNLNTGVTYEAKTNGDGFYSAPNLPPGIYRANVTKDGFKSIVKGDIELHVQDVASINFQLQIGSVNETVTVEGGAPLVNTEDAAVSTVIDREFVQNLPLNGRSFNTLLALTPGVTIAQTSGVAPGQFSVNGQRTNANSFQVDGVSVNFGSAAVAVQSGGGGTQAFNAYGGTSSLVSVDALQEFRVETSSYAPEFGRTPGGQVIISTRSGTSQFHGDVFDYFRNDVLDANDWFANAAGQPRAAERQNDFGGVFGGPIIRDKTFFFFSYEGLRLRQPQSRLIQVPSLAWRASAIPAAAAILNAYPKPAQNAPVSPDGFTSPFTGVWSNQVTMDAVSFRADHTFNSRLSLFGRYNRSPSHSILPMFSLSSAEDLAVNTTTFTAGATWLISGNISDSLRFNYSSQTAFGSFQLDNFGGATPPSPAALFPPGTTPNDGFALFDPTFSNVALPPPILLLGIAGGRNQVAQWNMVNDLSATKGSHQFKFGADYRRLPNAQTGDTTGINYDILDAAQFASTATVPFVFNPVTKPAKFHFESFSAYAQDRWRIGRRFSLAYGLRWEVNPAPSPKAGTFLASWQNVDNPALLALAPAGTPVWKTTYANLAPRVGIAWQVTQNGDLVVRGGWGIFYDLGTGPAAGLGAAFPNGATFVGFNIASPFPVPITDTASITPTFSLQPPYVSQQLNGFSANLKLPYSYQWNVAVEKSLWNKQALSLTYVGQAGRRLLRTEGLTDPNANFQGSTFLLMRNGDTSDYNALQVQFKRPLSQRLQALLNYTWSHSIDTNSDDSFVDISHVALSVAGQRGSSQFDVRHTFSGAVTFEVPALKSNVFLKKLSENWSLDGVFQARSGFPLNISTISVPIPGQGSTVTRPDLVPGVPIWIVGGSLPGGKRLNPAAFSVPTTSRQGTLGRNVIPGFGATQIDTSIGRKFPLTEKLNLQFRADVFNVFNHPNFSSVGPFGAPFGSCSPVSATSRTCQPFGFGQATQMLNRGLGGLNALYQIGGPRSMQLSLKLSF